MKDINGQNVVVTGGSRGLGLGIVEALVERKARVTVVARGREALDAVGRRLGVATVQGDIADDVLANRVLAEVRPSILVLNAGAMPVMKPLSDLTWDEFSTTWTSDVKGGFHWIQAALRLPLPNGSRVLVMSSGAAVNGSPLSGGYGGAKRMLWLMAQYANGVAKERGKDLRFQAIVPRQMLGATDFGRACAGAYAAKNGVPIEKFLENFGRPMSPREVGEHVATILTDPAYEAGIAYGVKGDTGITSLDA